MRDLPILFSAPMVRALLDGTKTQTRRVIDFELNEIHAKGVPLKLLGDWPLSSVDSFNNDVLIYRVQTDADDFRTRTKRCPYGATGDRLWVKETIRRGPTMECPRIEYRDTATYAADGAPTPLDTWPWKRNVLTAIHTPRGLSRLTLEITGVRVEKVQDISEEDARAEGGGGYVSGHGPTTERALLSEPGYWHPRFYRDGFAALWDTINAKRGFGWDANPWVWVVSFRRVEAAVRAQLEEVGNG